MKVLPCFPVTHAGIKTVDHADLEGLVSGHTAAHAVRVWLTEKEA